MVNRKKRGRIALGMIAGAAVFAASAATTGAYLTRGTQNLKNMFESGNVTVEVQEPDWQEKSGESMLPGESRKKNPLVKNTGTLDAWIFLEVNIPVRSVILVDESTKKKLPKSETELFHFQANEGWKLVEQKRTENDMRYVYGWKEPVMPTGQTGTLFDSITMVPYLEGSLDEQEVQQITVTARAVQNNIASPGTGLKELYQIYLDHQN